MAFQKLPTSLKMDHLFLDVRLEAVPLLGNSVVDLLGNRTFSVGMMQQNKGFGITNISIETKASLQPIVEITFKDLCGNTVFGVLTDNNNNQAKLDYSLLFDWPPPKFRFTFKGYLGRPVTWIMNLKKTVTTLNATDGSFEIKASFVPNQWGFLSDIPFLYLLAKKRLKRDLNKDASQNANQTKIESIFDIIKIGKTVEVKTKQISKEFDKLKKQLSVLKANAIDGLINKDFEPNDTIDGRVAGRQPIKGVKGVSGQNDLGNFSAITISLSTALETSDSIKLQESLKGLKANATNSLNEHRKIIALIGNSNSTAKNMPLGQITSDIQSDVNAGQKIIDDNLKLIDLETKRRLFETSSTELGAITISEVFSRLSADGAFILGSILDAGYTGFQNNQAARLEKRAPNGQPLIGRYFPLTIDAASGEQVPAFDVGITGLGAEMDFVRKFIVAISEGIADNQASASQDDISSVAGENKLTARINNLEIINPNPYKDASAQQIKENLLVRSGIAAFITRSYDPNRPGDYLNTSGIDNDSGDEIKQLADKEIKNITDDVLNSLSAEDYSELKRFCRFINNLLDPSGKNFLSSGVQMPIPTSITDVKSFRSIITKGGTIEDLGSIESEFRKFVSPNSIFHETTPKGLTDSISFDTFTAGYMYNNNTLWAFPAYQNITDKYTYVVFSNSVDRSSIDSTMNNDSDSEFTQKDDRESDKPKGIIKVTNGSEDETRNPDENIRVNTLNERIKKGLVLDYARLQNLNTIPSTKVGDTYYPNLSELNDGKGVLITSAITENNIGNGLTYTVYSHVTNDARPYLTWGLFKTDYGSDRRGTNQRIFLRRICTDLENRMSRLEDEKNNILSQVLGKAQSAENSLYIQMHHIFHQWGVLGFSMDAANTSSNKNSNGDGRVVEHPVSPPGQIAVTLEKTYGDIVELDSFGNIIATRNVGDDANVPVAPGGNASSMGFRYDFPMERINPPVDTPRTNVAHSIINIEPLYSPGANTTLLNIIQQICSKNNFMFVPIPGNIDYTNISKIFEPSLGEVPKVGNVFHVLFTPTPESRSKQNDGTPLSLTVPQKNNFDAFEIEFGSVNNAIIKDIQVSTTDDKPTAESILNLQRLVDKENSNKTVTTDCSVLSVMEGRSYKMQVEMLGNAQISPMQYFYVAKMPIFSGLYQVMNVKHSIGVNNMMTTFEGIKMRFDGSQMKGVAPITLESLKALGSTSNVSQPLVNSASPNPTPPTPLVPEPMEQRITEKTPNKNTPVSNNNNTNTKGIYLPGGKGPRAQDPTLDSLVNGYVNEARYRKILNSLPSKTTKQTMLAIDAPDFQLPMSYTRVSSKFGLRSYNANTGKNDPDNPDFHPGIDLVGSPNAEIRSIADGTVYLARRISSREETITLSTLAIAETTTRITGAMTLGTKPDGTKYVSNAASTGFVKYIRNMGTTYEIKVTWSTPDVGMGSGYGQVVIVKHNDRFYSLYAHLNEVKVTKGQTIRKGDPIGTQGNTMDGVIRSTGAHLHFEIWDKSVCNADFACAVNPEYYLTV